MTGIRIQMRRGTAAQWASVNPVLAAGEWGLDTTNKLVKIGDGTSTWSQLTVADPKAHAATHAAAGGDPVTLAQSQVTNLTNDLAGKAASVHSHAQSDVTGLVSDLAGKAASVHSHAQSDVTGLDTALSGKASTTHASTHASAGSDPIALAQSQVTNLTTDLAALASLAGATFTGDVTVSKATPILTISASGATGARFYHSADAGQAADIRFRTGSSNRWILRGKNSTSESGANAGSDFAIEAYSDTGTLLSTPLTITRATGATTFGGDVTVSKATARLIVDATSNDGYVFAGAAADKYAGIYLRTGSSPRWALVKSNYGEPGSNVGSDLLVTAHNDAGASLGTQVSVERANGRVTLFNVGATGGLALGSSGPRVMSGTGSPEGVVTAPVGSTWRDTSATTGAVKWIKASGAGNTGWKVEYGDTGVRNVAAGLLTGNGYTSVFSLTLRRVADTVTLYAVTLSRSGGTGSGDLAFYTLPSGFRPPDTIYQRSAVNNLLGFVLTAGDCLIRNPQTGEGLTWSWSTAQAWPTVLP